MKALGDVLKYGDNIDTDVIIPARYLNSSDPVELATHCMEDLDIDFLKKLKPGDIVIGGKNFGCGSSREHAPLCIKAAGVSCVIAKSFARIFYRNAINIGFPILECEEAVNDAKTGHKLEVDFKTGTIKNVTLDKAYTAHPFPEFIINIMENDGLVNCVRDNKIQWGKTLTPSKEFNIAVIPGDGIGVEVTAIALQVMEKTAEKYNVTLNFTEMYAGGCAIDRFGEPLPAETLVECQQSAAVLLGAVGGPQWDHLGGDQRPEKALLGLRGGLGLYANLRPAKIYEELKSASPLKDSIIANGIDMLIVRELTGGIYFGERGRKLIDGLSAAFDSEVYSEKEISRIARTAFEAALKRKNKVTLVDKANILETSRLWREVVATVAKAYPQVELNYMYVDNAAMQLVRNPSQFDVILTSNMFGDILSDEASMITGSIGMLASASVREDSFGMYEPIHGSAPDIAGQDLANPLAQILSAAMLFEYSLHLPEAARVIENAVQTVLHKGYRTGDIWTPGFERVGTQKMGDLVLAEI